MFDVRVGYQGLVGTIELGPFKNLLKVNITLKIGFSVNYLWNKKKIITFTTWIQIYKDTMNEGYKRSNIKTPYLKKIVF